MRSNSHRKRNYIINIRSGLFQISISSMGNPKLRSADSFQANNYDNLILCFSFVSIDRRMNDWEGIDEVFLSLTKCLDTFDLARYRFNLSITKFSERRKYFVARKVRKNLRIDIRNVFFSWRFIYNSGCVYPSGNWNPSNSLNTSPISL